MTPWQGTLAPIGRYASCPVMPRPASAISRWLTLTREMTVHRLPRKHRPQKNPLLEQTTAETDAAATNPQADTQPATTADATDSNSPTGTATLTAAEQPGTVPANGSSGASSGGGTTLSQMEQNMQRLYQQRQQLQAQQGRAAQTPAP